MGFAINMRLLSFGYKYGAPKEATHIFNVSGYPSPDASLCKKLNGTHKKLRKYLMNQCAYQQLFERIINESTKYKNDSIVAIGCGEGILRSVAMVEYLKEHSGIYFEDIIHRDLHKKEEQLKKRKGIDERRHEKQNHLEFVEDEDDE